MGLNKQDAETDNADVGVRLMRDPVSGELDLVHDEPDLFLAAVADAVLRLLRRAKLLR